MGKTYFTFIVRLLILSGVLAMAAYFYFSQNPGHYFRFFPAMFAIFMLLPVFVYIFLLSRSKDMKKFPNHYMIAMMLKFFLLAGLALYYKLTVDQNITAFLLSFFLLYVAFQVFETSSILKYIKRKG
jgi:FtsH-binding integral membrane protein